MTFIKDMFSRLWRQSGMRRRVISSSVPHQVLILEQRIHPAANLRLTDVFLVNGDGDQIQVPMIGETVRIHARWTATGVQQGKSYVVRFVVNDVPLDVVMKSKTSETTNLEWTRWDWIARPGASEVRVQLDSGRVIAESSEGDNTRAFTFQARQPSNLRQKFVWPVAGVRGRDWSITNYVDNDARLGRWSDYLGGDVTYDGHNAIDIAIANFAAMDEGVSVLAAAGGTVRAVVDGNIDRNLLPIGAENPPDSNSIVIDHGNGWATHYDHLARNSIRVNLNDRVTRGHVIAEVGSSGHSNGAHLHFVVTYHGSIVDPMLVPSVFFVTPPAYQGTRQPEAIDFGTTNDWFRSSTGDLPDLHERPSEVRVFSTREQKAIYFWTTLTQTHPGDDFVCRWYRPDGSLAFEERYGTKSRTKMDTHLSILSVGSTTGHPGIWKVSLQANGRVVAQTPFRVVTAKTPPEIRVRLGEMLVLSQRRTPISFGNVQRGTAQVLRTFTIENHGGSELQLSNLLVSPAFRLVSKFSSRVVPGQSVRITIALSTGTKGLKTGVLSFRTNDADESTISIQLEGVVT